MIGTIDIKVNAAKPSFPLPPLVTFVNSPSQVRLVNVPKAIGDWRLTKVYVSVAYPDNMIYSPECALDGGCYHATIPAPSTSGTATKSFKVLADGVKEDGVTSVTGYLLGVGDILIVDTDGTISTGGTTNYLHWHDTQPTTPQKGDICIIGGTVRMWDGNSWVVFCVAPVTSVNSMTGDVTLTAADVGAPTTSDLNRVSATANGAATNARNATLAIASHTGNTSNPHSVTKSQVGLGNVDNTSDADKPVSTAQQTALNGKVSKQTGYGLAQIGTPSSYGALNIKVIGDDGTTSQVGIYNKDALDSTVSTINSSIASKASNSSLTSHTGNTSNPHNVTAAQIGAVSKTTIEALGDDYTMDDIAAKINAIIRALAPCIIAMFGLFAFGDTIDTARLGSLKSSAMVVTNVHFTAYQPILTAGENITISNNVISAAGGGSVAPTGFEDQTNTISYPTIAGNSVNLSITDAGVLAVDANGWTDGQAVFVKITPVGSYTVANNITLVGYGTFPTAASQCMVWRVGSTFYLSVISAL